MSNIAPDIVLQHDGDSCDADTGCNDQTLTESTGKNFPIRGAIVFPGWFVDPMTTDWKRALPRVLEPKALPEFIRNEPDRLREDDVKLAAYHLARHIRTWNLTT